jgi:hypothetical protein
LLGSRRGEQGGGLRAAYALAIRSKIDPALPQAMRTLGIVVKPLANTAALSQFNRMRKRNLNALELGAFLKRFDGSAALLLGSLLKFAVPSRMMDLREIGLIAEGSLLESTPVRVDGGDRTGNR